MSLAIVYSRAAAGIAAPLVTVEVHLAKGIAGLNIVGLPEAEVKESKHRVRSAIVNAGFDFPVKRITINLAPADLPKEGGRFDLPIALGILAASEQIPSAYLGSHEFVGELALSGELRPLRGVLPVVLSVYKQNRRLIIPYQNASEAGLVPEARVLAAKHLLDVCAYLHGAEALINCLNPVSISQTHVGLDFSDVRGQAHAKRALEIAATGQHSVLMIGPPGTGKTMLASRFCSILPAIDEQQALEVAAIASLSHSAFDPAYWRAIPFRAPHHTCSSVALVGGGRPPRPGEISLAHHGVLFLDELPEFNRHSLECLREPLESGQVTVSRAAYQSVFPAQFHLLAAMNPCPCGYAGSLHTECVCSDEQVKRYIHKLSGPLLDRIDMQVEVATISHDDLLMTQPSIAENSECIRQRVLIARMRQVERQGKANAQLSAADLVRHAKMNQAGQDVLLQALKKFHFSTRAYHRLIKIGRTIADLAGSVEIDHAHMAEALGYRCLDRTRKA